MILKDLITLGKISHKIESQPRYESTEDLYECRNILY